MCSTIIYRKIYKKTCFSFILKNLFRKNISTMKNIQGVIFDMDGTLTIPVLNFKDLRRRLNIGDDIDILEYLKNITDQEKQKECFRIVEEFEDEGNKKLTLQPNIFKLFEFLKNNSLHRALITRNNSKCVDSFIGKFLTHDENKWFEERNDLFSVILCRDFKPVKPHPASALHVCSEWNIDPSNVIFVGDDLQDIQCGKAAGTWTALKLKGNNDNVKPLADISIGDLSELISILEKKIETSKP